MLVLTIPEMKCILPRIHPCFTDEETRTEKGTNQLKLVLKVGAGIRTQIQDFRLQTQSQGLCHHKAPCGPYLGLYVVINMQSTNANQVATEPPHPSPFSLGTKLIAQLSYRPSNVNHTTHSIEKLAQTYSATLKINVVVMTTLFYFP